MTKHQRILAIIVTWAAIGFIVGLLLGLGSCAAPLFLTKEEHYYRQQWSDPNIEQRLNEAISEERKSRVQ
jgi:hypothetical protein